MADILRMNESELQRHIEATISRLQGAAPAPVNPRPEGEDDADDTRDAGAPAGTATRGTRAGKRSRELTQDEAKGILSFFRGVAEKDGGQVMRSLVALGQSQQRLQQVGVSIDGGYTVPEQFVSEVLIELPKVTPFADANLVRIVPMQSETMRWTKVISKPSMPGYVAEGASYSKSGVTFGPITLVAKKIGEIIPFTEEIMKSNQVGMVQIIAELVAEAFAFKYNNLITNGAGDATEPEGVLTNSEIASVAWVATDDRTRADSIIDGYHGIASQYRRQDTMWLMHDTNIKLVRKLKDTQGRYIWTDGFNDRPATLLGRPVFENPDLPTGTILFGNFKRGYIVGKRDGMTADQNSSGTDWEKDITNFKFRERWDGRVHDVKAFCKVTGVS